MEQPPSHIAIVSTPGMGHLIPLGVFAKRLIRHHHFSVTFLVPTDGPLSANQEAFFESLPDGISHILLPQVNFDDLSEDVKIETRISLTMAQSIPSLREAVRSLVGSTGLVALVVDPFGTDAFEVAREFNLSPYIFFPSTAMALSLFLHLPKLDQAVSCEYRDLSVEIPGCVPIDGKYLLDPLQDRSNDAYKWVLHHTKRYRLAEGIMVNSFKKLEGGAIKALQEQEPGKPPVYPIGPLINMDSGGGVNGSECLRWLSDQPRGSVLFISFGSGGTLSYDQLNELALGLEMSKQRFLWVVNAPFAFLPKGFLDRTKGYGLVVRSRAPRAQILSLGSTGGFLTHCDWDSTLKSVVHGIPLITWPLYAEQKMNAVMLTEDLKVALKVKVSENSIVGRTEIAKVVKDLMKGIEGTRVRFRMRKLKHAASKVLSKDGDSTKSLAELAEKWKNRMSN